MPVVSLSRYFAGVAVAVAGFAGTFATIVVIHELSRSPVVRVHNVVGAVAAFSLVSAAGLALVLGPCLLLIRTMKQTATARLGAVLLGVLFSPLHVLVAALVFRESHESFMDLLAFWQRVPGELLASLIPGAVAATLLSIWILPATEPRSLKFDA